MGSDSGECWWRTFTLTCFGHQSRFVGADAPWLNGHLASGKVLLFLASGETLPDEVASVFSICFRPSNFELILREENYFLVRQRRQRPKTSTRDCVRSKPSGR